MEKVIIANRRKAVSITGKVLLVTFLILIIHSSLFANFSFATHDGKARVIDEANLLTDEEILQLEYTIEQFVVMNEFDVLFITVNDVGDKTSEEYADDFWDQNGYGHGQNRDGAMVLINMGDREMHIGTCGYGIEVLTDYGIHTIEEEMIPEMQSGDYVYAFETFMYMTEEYLDMANAGEPFDVPPHPPFPIILGIIASIIVGIVGGFVGTGMLKSQLQSVRYQARAKAYVVDKAIAPIGTDRFLYSDVVATPIPKNDDDGGFSGGSTTHVSAGGITHGGHTSKF